MIERLIRQSAALLRSQDCVRHAVDRVCSARASRIDRQLHISTIPGSVPETEFTTVFDDAAGYLSIHYSLLRRFYRKLDLRSDDLVFDIGCGMGRALCLCAREEVRRCVGIEVSPALAVAAAHNARTLCGRHAPIEIRQEDAAMSDYSGGTVYLMFNPFGPATVRRVLDRIYETLRISARRIRILYVRPYQYDVLEACGWLTLTRTIEPLLFGTVATYWTNTELTGDEKPIGLEVPAPRWRRELSRVIEAAAAACRNGAASERC